MQTLNTKQPIELNEIAAFDVTGEDAASFLQGQLTQDVSVWQPNEIKRAAWCNVKGRMLATFYIWQIEDGFRLLIARDLAAKVLPRLRMFVMRAKVKVSEPLTVPLLACTSTLPALSHDSQVFTLLDQYGVTFSSQSIAPATTTAWTTAHTRREWHGLVQRTANSLCPKRRTLSSWAA
jgi:folate-binding Fe-S cluster repair protein YgfZ